MFACEEDALEIEVDLRIPHLFGHLGRTARRGSADVVDQHMQATPGVGAGSDHPRNRVAVGHVAAERLDGAANFAHACEGLLEPGGIAVDREDLCPFLRESEGRGSAIAPPGADAAGAGHDSNLVGEALVHGNRCRLAAADRVSVSSNSGNR